MSGRIFTPGPRRWIDGASAGRNDRPPPTGAGREGLTTPAATPGRAICVESSRPVAARPSRATYPAPMTGRPGVTPSAKTDSTPVDLVNDIVGQEMRAGL